MGWIASSTWQVRRNPHSAPRKLCMFLALSVLVLIHSRTWIALLDTMLFLCWRCAMPLTLVVYMLVLRRYLWWSMPGSCIPGDSALVRVFGLRRLGCTVKSTCDTQYMHGSVQLGPCRHMLFGCPRALRCLSRLCDFCCWVRVPRKSVCMDDVHLRMLYAGG